LAVSG
jgi:hypothetical protein